MRRPNSAVHRTRARTARAPVTADVSPEIELNSPTKQSHAASNLTSLISVCATCDVQNTNSVDPGSIQRLTPTAEWAPAALTNAEYHVVLSRRPNTLWSGASGKA